jgi:protein-disulfide isomerase
MDRMKSLFLVVFLLFFSSAFPQQGSTDKAAPQHASKPANSGAKEASSPTLLPGTIEIDAALQRTFGYDPGMTWKILDIRESAIPGIAQVLVSINRQQPVQIYLSPDMQNAIIGEMIPFGPNPFAPTREKLKVADGPSRGAGKPAIDIVEFSDLECPHCKAAQPILEKLVGDFPQVRYVFQQFPLPASIHPWAKKAAEYADCAARENKDAFWKYVDAIFENQGSIAAVTADGKLKELATGAGLDANKVSACAGTPETEARVDKSLQLGQSLDVNQTPTVFINGRRVAGIANIPYEQLKSLVQFEIDHAGK